MRKFHTNFTHATRHVALGLSLLALVAAGCQEGEKFFDDVLKEDRDDNQERVRVFASTNTGSNFTVFDVADLNKVSSVMYPTSSPDADGIYYDQATQTVFQLSRTANRINAYTSASDFEGEDDAMLAFSSSSDFTNGREIAVSGDKLVVAEDVEDANQLIVYTISEHAITFERAYNVDFNVWGVHLDENTLYAVQDNTNKIAVFEDFFSNEDDHARPTYSVAIEGLVRTHGITYNDKQDILVLTDIGDAASDSDGGFHVIEHFMRKLREAGDGGTIALDDQVRVAGDDTRLGNPVDIAFDYNNQKVYVAERARDGGLFLVFNYPMENGNSGPLLDRSYPGASAVYFSAKR